MKIPIVLADASQMGGVAGICQTDNGVAKYIAIDSSLFNEPIYDWYPLEIVAYKVLLHEIGHCVFSRGHDSEKIEATGFQFLVTATAENGSTMTVKENAFAKSIMWHQEAAPNVSINILNSLRSYYVRELLGKDHFNTTDDLKRYIDFTLSPVPPE